MIKRISKNFSVFILLIFIGVIAYKIGQWRTWRPKEKSEPVFITDTLDYEYPDYVEKPGLIFKFTRKSIPPRSIQPIKFKPWMDSVYCAYSIKISNGEMEIKGKRGQVSHEYIYDDVPPNVEIYGTEIGFNIIKHRFKNPFGWSGISIGTRIYYDRMVVPYLEIGIRIKKFNFSIGVDKLSIYADVSWRIW